MWHLEVDWIFSVCMLRSMYILWIISVSFLQLFPHPSANYLCFWSSVLFATCWNTQTGFLSTEIGKEKMKANVRCESYLNTTASWMNRSLTNKQHQMLIRNFYTVHHDTSVYQRNKFHKIRINHNMTSRQEGSDWTWWLLKSNTATYDCYDC